MTNNTIDTKEDQLHTEIVRIIELTKSGQLRWQKVPGQYCTYQTCNEMQPYLLVSCCRPDYRIEIEGIPLPASQGAIMILCGEILEQIRQSNKRLPDIMSLLHAIG